MKRIIVIFLLVCCILVNNSFAESDLIFQNVLWLSDEATTIQAINDAGLLREIICFPLSKEKNTYILTDDGSHYRPDVLADYESACFSMSLNGYVKGKVAGYPIDDLILSFAYDGEYKLIAIRVSLLNSSYSEIKTKLMKAYGKGEFSVTEDLIESTIWKGDNNSAILLYTQSEGYDYTLIYGRIDAVEILSNCLALPDPNDILGL